MRLLDAAASWVVAGHSLAVCDARGVQVSHTPSRDLTALAELAMCTPGATLAVECTAALVVLEVPNAANLLRLHRAELLRGCSELWTTPRGFAAVFLGLEGDPHGPAPDGYRLYASGELCTVPPSVIDGVATSVLEHRGGRRPLRWPAVAALAGATPSAGRADGIVARVGAAPRGSRFATLRWAAHRAVETGHAERVPDLVAAAEHAGLPPRDAQRAVRGLRSGQQATTCGPDRRDSLATGSRTPRELP